MSARAGILVGALAFLVCAGVIAWRAAHTTHATRDARVEATATTQTTSGAGGGELDEAPAKVLPPIVPTPDAPSLPSFPNIAHDLFGPSAAGAPSIEPKTVAIPVETVPIPRARPHASHARGRGRKVGTIDQVLKERPKQPMPVKAPPKYMQVPPANTSVPFAPDWRRWPLEGR